MDSRSRFGSRQKNRGVIHNYLKNETISFKSDFLDLYLMTVPGKQ